MLVLLGPSFAGGDAEYQRLSKVTGMVVYDYESTFADIRAGRTSARQASASTSHT